MKRIAISVLICSLLIGTTGCRTAPGAPVKDLAVAGSTFAEPLYVKQLDAWYQKTQVKAVYGALSSSGALRALQDRTIDVGATDLLLTPEEQARLPASVLKIPTCLGAVAVCVNLPGNAAMAAMIRQTSGSIGYLEYTFAVQSSLTCIALRNRSGAFITPSVDSMKAAIPADLTADLQGTLLNRPGATSYPIVSLTWLVCYRDQSYDGRSRERAVAVYDLVSWLLGDGQSLVEPLQYGSLPDSVRKAARDILAQLTWQGKPVK
jgi:ABC-type phosphate transport system substrate-binding protein